MIDWLFEYVTIAGKTVRASVHFDDGYFYVRTLDCEPKIGDVVTVRGERLIVAKVVVSVVGPQKIAKVEFRKYLGWSSEPPKAACQPSECGKATCVKLDWCVNRPNPA